MFSFWLLVLAPISGCIYFLSKTKSEVTEKGKKFILDPETQPAEPWNGDLTVDFFLSVSMDFS